MTVVTLGAIRRYSGLSIDTKPTSRVPSGSTFNETDSGRNWTYDGTIWWRDPDPVSTAAIEALLTEQTSLLRSMLVGISKLSDIDLTDLS
jgi:hypothetical protein